MLVRDAMSTVVLTIGPQHTLREAASRMTDRRVGAAVVMDSDSDGVGILTERDILRALADGQDPDEEIAASHLTSDIVFASPDWTLHAAATAMLHGGFRHLIVLDAAEVTGILSVRDIVRMWASSFEDV